MALGEGKIEWSQEAPTSEKGLFVAVLVLILYASSVWMWSPQRAQTKIAKKEIEQLQSQIVTFEKILLVKVTPVAPAPEAPLTTPKRDPIANDPRFAPYLKGEFPTQEQMLQEVSAELAIPKVLGKVELAGIDFGEGLDKGDYREIPFDLRIEGTYQDTVNYLQRIEKIPILVVFRGIDIQAKTDNPAQLETHLTAAAFVVKSAAALQESATSTTTPPSGAVPAATPPGGHP